MCVCVFGYVFLDMHVCARVSCVRVYLCICNCFFVYVCIRVRVCTEYYREKKIKEMSLKGGKLLLEFYTDYSTLLLYILTN